MSAPGPGPGSGRSGPPGWSPLHFRATSPYAPSPPPRLGSPGMSMFGARHPHMPCPRPRWPSPGPRSASPLPHGASPPPILGPRPFRMPMHPPSPAPMRCVSPVPDYFRGVSPYVPTERMSPYTTIPSSPPYFEYGPPSRDYEYVGAPHVASALEHPPLPQNYEANDEENDGPSTAEIIANQSQDYIDEKLAEYQMTIYQLQGKINSFDAVRTLNRQSTAYVSSARSTN